MTQKHRLIGSIFIIAGTTIGAGMLALPIASAGLGFIASSLLMVVIWMLMAYTAILLINLHQNAPINATLHTLADQFLGQKGKRIAAGSTLFLFYALCAAYIAGGGAQMAVRLSSLTGFSIPAHVGSVLVASVMAIIVSADVKRADLTNRALFMVKLALLAITFKALIPQVLPDHLTVAPVNNVFLISALPVIFTSFGFHGSIPAIVRYMEGNHRALKKAVLIGSAIPLVIYLLWQLVTQGSLSRHLLQSATQIDQLLPLLGSRQDTSLSAAVNGFADLALLTSFLGVSLGLYDYIADMIGRSQRSRCISVTFLPPLTFALFYPQGFIMALGYAALALVVLAVFLPIAMTTKLSLEQQSSAAKPLYLALAGTLGGIICLSQVAQTLGIIPTIG